MNMATWIIQGLLALVFIYSGWLKAFQYEKVKASWGWVKTVPRGFVNFVGLIELAGAIGLILPQATGITPVLTPLAAIGLAVIVFCGGVIHLRRNEYKEIIWNMIFCVLAVFVAVVRF